MELGGAGIRLMQLAENAKAVRPGGRGAGGSQKKGELDESAVNTVHLIQRPVAR
jgi:hypothetical protein